MTSRSHTYLLYLFSRCRLIIITTIYTCPNPNPSPSLSTLSSYNIFYLTKYFTHSYIILLLRIFSTFYSSFSSTPLFHLPPLTLVIRLKIVNSIYSYFFSHFHFLFHLFFYFKLRVMMLYVTVTHHMILSHNYISQRGMSY